MGKTVTPENCPDPSVHGNPFRYCPNCSWIEEPSVEKPPNLLKYSRSFVLNLDTTDRLDRDTFIFAMEYEAQRFSQEMVTKMVEDYDARKAADPNPVRPDTVVS